MNSTTAMLSMLLPQGTLEALIPGYGILLHFITSYFSINTSSYILIAFCVCALPAFWDRFLLLLLRLTISIEIPYHDNLYDHAIHWISNYPGLSQAQRSTATTRLNADSWNTDNEKDLSEEDKSTLQSNTQEFWKTQKIRDRLSPICYQLAPSQTCFFKYKGCLFAVSCRQYTDTFGAWPVNRVRLYFYAAPWKRKALHDLIVDIQKASIENDNDSVRIYRGLKNGSQFRWTHLVSKRRRPLSTIAAEHEKKEQVTNDMQNYLLPDTRNWYWSNGIPYGRGYVFYGPPGTGKSSFSLGIASQLWLDIYMISLTANDLDENNLILLFQSLPRRCIVLIEDVDQAGIKKRQTENSLLDGANDGEATIAEAQGRPSNGITLAAVLNVIDGVCAQEGRILIMTTNHIDQLDPALLRPGRVDMKVLFGYADRSIIPADGLFMTEKLPNGSIRPSSQPASPDWTPDDIISLSTSFADKVSPNQHTAAEIQSYLLLYRNDPYLAVNDATAWWNKHLLIGWDVDLSLFYVSNDRFKIHDTAYRIRVAAFIFCYRWDEKSHSYQLCVLLLQRALSDSKPSLWESSGAGGVEGTDKTLQDALGREVREETGLDLLRITDSLPMQKWTTARSEWIGFSSIIEVTPSQLEKIKLNPTEHQAFAWATENEIKDGKYSFYGEHQTQTLKAFSVMQEKRLPLPTIETFRSSASSRGRE
ncbi:hypothetical protein BDV24DRAFT_172530 [Aspergillus arachidicola]|uniref:Nudix hydrolase domain-containing protein n=1 Tax=Aspergillus arachidicola TaxID=656916 RepID=A0A5N6XNG8_9EURO|nr:hypothetical protein BDV24DRAFT_172530 [Aspergillus arachidicola]